MQNLLRSLTFMLLLFACGKTTMPGQIKNTIFTTSFENEPVLLALQYPECMEEALDFYSLDLHLFLRGKISKNPGSFILNRKVVSEIYHGEESELIQTKIGPNNLNITKEPRPLRLCLRSSGFERNTIESAAVNTSFFIMKTNQRFRQIVPEVSLEPIELHILPLMKSTLLDRRRDGSVSKQSLYMTDNAFYVPSKNMISFLPHSKALKDSGFETNFWEVPMVASHEYGHHIFRSVFGDSTSTLEGCFGHTHQIISTKEARIVSKRDVIRAYNEGFADLISWYTLDPSERTVRNVRCLEFTRDVSSSRFVNGKIKRFGKDVLKAFFSKNKTYIPASCEDITFQEIHSLGAIFAFSADQFFSTLKLSDEQKLSVLVDWIRYLKGESEKNNDISPEAFLNQTYGQLVRMSMEKSRLFYGRRICRRIQDAFPDLDLPECNRVL